MLRVFMVPGLFILFLFLTSSAASGENTFGEDDDGDGRIDEENPYDLIDNDSDGLTDEGDYGQYSITVGPIRDSRGNKLQGVTIWAMVTDDWGYRAKTAEDGQLTFDYLPWAEFPLGTTFTASHDDFDEDITWEQGDKIPEFQAASRFPCCLGVIPVIALALVVLSLVVWLNRTV